MKIFRFIMMPAILLAVSAMSSSTVHGKTVVKAKHTEDHHRMQRLLQSVTTFFDRDSFNAAVDEQLAGRNRTSFFEDFETFAGMGTMSFNNETRLFFGNGGSPFEPPPLVVPAVSSGLPEVFTLAGPDDNSFVSSDTSLFNSSIFGVSAFFTIFFSGSGFIRFPEPGVTAFFADFAGTNNQPGLGTGPSDTSLDFALTMRGTGTIQLEQLLLPATSPQIAPSLPGVASFGFLISDDFFGVDEIEITVSMVRSESFGLDNVAGVFAPPLPSPFCCTVQFNTCLNNDCDNSAENCIGGPCGDDSFFFPLVEDPNPLTCSVRQTGCSMSSECCGPLECLPREGDDVPVCEVPSELLSDTNSRLGRLPP